MEKEIISPMRENRPMAERGSIISARSAVAEITRIERTGEGIALPRCTSVRCVDRVYTSEFN